MESMIVNTVERSSDGEVKIKLSCGQGTQLLQCSALNEWPKELGGVKYEYYEQSSIIEELRMMGSALKAYSPWARKRVGRKLLFGEEDNWEVIKEVKTDIKCPSCGFQHEVKLAREVTKAKDEYLMETVRLNEQAQNGVYWALLIMAHPSSPLKSSGDFLDEIVWPIARALEFDRQLRKDLGLTNPKGPRIYRNNAKEWEEEIKKSLDSPDKK